jgi:rRNA pseudouridine-1189 N-methylase Emg1 (Nep1/Mra1 family)
MNRLQRTALSFANWLIPTDDKIKDNKDVIMKHLYHTNFSPLTTEQSIELFVEVHREFLVELNERLELAKEEQRVIENYLSY